MHFSIIKIKCKKDIYFALGDNTIYVGDLPPSYVEETIQLLLKPHGKVTSMKVCKRVNS